MVADAGEPGRRNGPGRCRETPFRVARVPPRMRILQRLKDALVPSTDPGVVFECTECGATFEEPREDCPECGSSEIKEEEGFELRPET